MTLPSSKIYLFQIKISVYVNFRFTSKLKNLTGSVLLYNITIKVKTLIFIVQNCTSNYSLLDWDTLEVTQPTFYVDVHSIVGHVDCTAS